MQRKTNGMSQGRKFFTSYLCSRKEKDSLANPLLSFVCFCSNMAIPRGGKEVKWYEKEIF